MHKIILIGGGGHCKASIDVIEQAGTFQIAGIVDVPEKLHQKIFCYEIIATDDDLPGIHCLGTLPGGGWRDCEYRFEQRGFYWGPIGDD